MAGDNSPLALEPRDRCPKCSGAVMVVSEDPLEEHCLNHPCDYYRAAGGRDGVIRE